jgi:hypothetical protein
VYVLLQLKGMIASLILKIDGIKYSSSYLCLLPIMPLCFHITYVMRAHGLCSYESEQQASNDDMKSDSINPSSDGHGLF